MKKLFALLLALTMVLSLATTAFADGDTTTIHNSITINNAVVGETYKIYKMLDLVVDSDTNPTKFTYTINSTWADFFAEDNAETDENEAGPGRQYVTITDGAITAISDAEALAKAAETWANEKKLTELSKIEATTTSVVFDNLQNGYYLITSTLGTVAMTETTPDKSAVTINEKNPKDTIEKEVKEDSTGKWGEENDAQVGDTVEFKSTATLNPHTTNVKIHDTMDDGLTYKNDVQIYTDENCTTKLGDGNYTVLATPDSGDTFTIQFEESYLASLTEQTKLYLTYTAVLNEKAVVKDEDGVDIVDQNNKTKITYGDKQSVEDKTTTTTHKSTVNKYADDIENLAGAIFSLKKGGDVVELVMMDDQNYRVATAAEIAQEGKTTETFVTVTSGDIVIWGLDTDTDYTLEEITAPAGYNKLDKEVPLTVEADNNAKTDVKNNSGTELPSTGGMGTTLFYIVGGIMVAAAAVLLVTKKRMSVEA